MRFEKYNFIHIQTQVVHCIKQCIINQKINYNPKTYKKLRL